MASSSKPSYKIDLYKLLYETGKNVLKYLNQEDLENLKDLGNIGIRELIFEYVKTDKFLKIASANDIFNFITIFIKNNKPIYQENIRTMLNYLDKNRKKLDYTKLADLHANIDIYNNNPRYRSYLEDIKRDIDNEIINRQEYYITIIENDEQLKEKLESKYFTLEAINEMITGLNEIREPIEQEWNNHNNQEHGMNLYEQLQIIDRKLELLNNQEYRTGLSGGKKK